MRERGSAVVEYAGIVAVVACLFAGLLLVRPVRPGHRAPVRPLPAIIRLIQAPAAPVVARTPTRPRRHRSRPHRPRTPPPQVLLPTWLAPGG